jgi:hypothetical protein
MNKPALAWTLDGLEVNVVGSISSRIAEHGAGTGLSAGDVSGWAASLYIAGACLGAIVFGQMSPSETVGRAARTGRLPIMPAPWFRTVRDGVGKASVNGETAALAAVCTIAPSAEHRFLFRHDDKRHIVFSSNRVVIIGLASLALAMCGCLLLVTTQLFGSTSGVLTAGVGGLAFAVLWFAVPLRTAEDARRAQER